MYNKNRPKRLRPKLLGSEHILGRTGERPKRLENCESCLSCMFIRPCFEISVLYRNVVIWLRTTVKIYKKKTKKKHSWQLSNLWRVLVFMGFNKFNKSITQTYNSNIHSPSRTSDQLSSVTSIGLHCVCEKNRIVTETNKTWNIFPDSCARASFPTAMGLD